VDTTNGKVVVRQAGGTDEVQYSHDGTKGIIDALDSDLWIGVAGHDPSETQLKSFGSVPGLDTGIVSAGKYRVGNSTRLLKGGSDNDSDNVIQFSATGGVRLKEYTAGILFNATNEDVGLYRKAAGVAEFRNGTAGRAHVEAASFSTNVAFIVDDSVQNVVPNRNMTLFHVVDDTNRNGLYLVDLDAGSIKEVSDLNTNIATGTGDHTGTTGTDGDFTVAANGTDGEIVIENRTGGSVSVRWTIIG